MNVGVAGIDLSLASTGMASSDGWTRRVQTKTVKGANPVVDGLRRMWTVRQEMHSAGVFGHHLVVMEGPSFGQMRQTGEHVRAGLWWIVAEECERAMVPLLVVPPATLKTYTTGKGNASKDAVLAAVIKRYGEWDVPGNDIADAVGLMAIGRRMIGDPVEQSLPQTHLRALGALTLPGGVG